MVDTSSLNIIKEVPNLVPFFSDSEFGIALRGVSRNRGSELVISFVISNVWSLVYYKEGLEPDPKLGSQVLPNFKMLFAMEPSTDKTLIFGCGTSQSNPGDACVAAFTFDRALAKVSERIFVGEGLFAATSMKRFRNRDDLCIGCRKDMIIVNFSNRGFEILNRISNVHSSEYFQCPFF